jgi:hypothetical protein
MQLPGDHYLFLPVGISASGQQVNHSKARTPRHGEAVGTCWLLGGRFDSGSGDPEHHSAAKVSLVPQKNADP